MADETLLDRAVNACITAHRVVVLTGAGISRACGIKDFRSADGLAHTTVGATLLDLAERIRAQETEDDCSIFNRLGSNGDIERLDNILTGINKETQKQSATSLFHVTALGDESMRRALSRLTALLRHYVHWYSSGPSGMHVLISELRDRGRLLHWYTQNIDGIEGQTGCRLWSPFREKTEFDVLQLHGGLQHAWCNKGHATEITRQMNIDFLQGREIPCEVCPTSNRYSRNLASSSLRPGIVLYDDDNLRVDDLHRLVDDAVRRDIRQKPDLLLITGTSLKIPGSVNLAKKVAESIKQMRRKRANYGCVVMINKSKDIPPTLTELVDVFVQMDCNDFAQITSAKLINLVSVDTMLKKPSTDLWDVGNMSGEQLSLLCM